MTDSIINKYIMGEMTLEEANAALKEAKSLVRLDPMKNVITPDEVKDYGLLNSGWGGLDKVAIKNMELAKDDMGTMKAVCYYMDKRYDVVGKKLVEM